MLLRFTKMHGLGNDFMVVDLISQRVHLSPEQIRYLGNRNTGVGFDQLLLVETPQSPDVDFRYRIFNSNGTEVEHCGNGARCFAKFVHDQRLTGKRDISVQTSNGRIMLKMRDDHAVEVDMGEPVLQPDQVPFEATTQAPSYSLEQDGHNYTLGVVSMGNPHAVLVVDDVASAPVFELGSKLEQHPRFPNKANIGFMQIIDRNTIKLRVFERGVGETKACGTGACAAVVVGQQQGLLDTNVTTQLTGGNLAIQWQGPGHHLFMDGPATQVYEGQIKL
ncbi:diaminopimelate epimerase [Oceanospirillaceae bacterium]|jgi:diaminopimelate epimerase|nr:diaminopimelate epimerase [Oceanospirillaceae bacterium]MBT4998424.1 diaminopimelate epimerase [Oceanospirillaceae bacterium]MBT5630707.1 diaminopimelate epimerase [Oceanospirillaceae bacterium]MBT6102059.1 diaminopimelate epimerase [Oceanospirillaceae bacterium]MBT7672994.1 diaminopimelate epimerase [Oceanospirillaceae bacterium]